MQTPEPGAPATSEPTGTLRRSWLRAVLPHVLTAAVAVAASLAVQAALMRPAPPTIPTPTGAPATSSPAARPSTPPAPTRAPAPPLAEGVTRQELADLHAEIDRLWATVYLTRAISQVADAEATLR